MAGCLLLDVLVCRDECDKCLTYRQVAVVSDASKGRKAWIPPEAPKGLRTARLGILVDLTLGELAVCRFRTKLGWRSAMFLARFSKHLQRKINLTNAFKSLFATILLSYAATSLDSLGNSA